METCEISRNMAQRQEFKSYYVVWKHIREKKEEVEEEKFKSYYVVWKRIYGDRYIYTQIGLNRTM